MGDNSNMVDNYRPVQPLHGRMVKSSFMIKKDVTSSVDGIALKVSNVVLMLMLFGVLFLM